MNDPVISIVTIAFNEERNIEGTILSVIRQSYKNIEYIIVDGGSKDNTMNIVNKYSTHINTIMSEKDNGIYDAMNKGLKLSTGDYVIFMNAGDEFYNTTIVEEAVRKGKNHDIFYGDTLFMSEDGRPLELMSKVRNRKVPEILNWKSLRFGMNVGHQSIFVKRNIAPDFDLSYRYSADIDWIIRTLKQSKSSTNTSLVISKFRLGGSSTQQLKKSLKERYRLLGKHYGFIPNLFNHFIILIKTLGKKRIKKIM